MRSSVACYLLVGVICLLQKQAFGIQCYVCNSFNDARCASDTLPDSMKMNCSTMPTTYNYTMCRKITQELEFQVGNLPLDSRVIRECGWDSSKYLEKCYQISGLGGKQEICSCTGDFCNSAPKSVPAVAMSLLASAVAFVYLKLA